MAVLRAVRSGGGGGGRESLVISAPYNCRLCSPTAAFLLSLVRQMAQTTQKWQSRDLVFVFVSSGGDTGTDIDIAVADTDGMEAWLRDYLHSDREMLRAGRIFVGLALDRLALSRLDRIVLSPEGAGHSLPNMDLVNVISTTAFEQGGRAGIDPHRAREQLDATLRGFLLFSWNSALSVPRTSAAYMMRQGVHAVGLSTFTEEPQEQLLLNPLTRAFTRDSTLRDTQEHIRHRRESINTVPRHMSAVGHVVSVVMHHLQNTDELLHQSFESYTMAGGTDFWEADHTMAAFFVQTLAVVALRIAYLLHCEHGEESTTSTTATAVLGQKVLRALPRFSAIILACLAVHAFPMVLEQMTILPIVIDLGTKGNGSTLINMDSSHLWFVFLLYCAAIAVLYSALLNRYVARFIAHCMTIGGLIPAPRKCQEEEVKTYRHNPREDRGGQRTAAPEDGGDSHGMSVLCILCTLLSTLVQMHVLAFLNHTHTHIHVLYEDCLLVTSRLVVTNPMSSLLFVVSLPLHTVQQTHLMKIRGNMCAHIIHTLGYHVYYVARVLLVCPLVLVGVMLNASWVLGAPRMLQLVMHRQDGHNSMLWDVLTLLVIPAAVMCYGYQEWHSDTEVEREQKHTSNISSRPVCNGVNEQKRHARNRF